MDQSLPASVKIWEEIVTIPTYLPMPPDPNPMFFERRVYQGSSGKVYPLPFTDRLSGERMDKAYKAVFLENEYLRLMVLPELGGRVQIGLDKTNGYNFVYHNRVIKPALIGLAGPWISGGIEWNWPQHHRPTTFMPVDYTLEEHETGSKTVWVGEIDPLFGMKGMAGITLHPGKSYFEAKVRLYNATPLPQTFMWWANLGVHVNENYQVLYPPDIDYVADHARRAVTPYPITKNPITAAITRRALTCLGTRISPLPPPTWSSGRILTSGEATTTACKPGSCTSPTTISPRGKSCSPGVPVISAAAGAAT